MIIYQNITALALVDSQTPWCFSFVFFQCNQNEISTNSQSGDSHWLYR